MESIGRNLTAIGLEILFLLHAEKDEGSSSLETPLVADLHDCAPLTTRRLMSPEKAAAERNTEISWMLELLMHITLLTNPFVIHISQFFHIYPKGVSEVDQTADIR